MLLPLLSKCPQNTIVVNDLFFVVFSESDSHFVPDPEALRDALQNTLREPLPPKHSVMPPKWLMTSAPEPGGKGSPRTPSNHPAGQYCSHSPVAPKPVRSISSAGTSTQQSSGGTLTSTSHGTKQPPLPPPKPVNRGNAPMLGKFCSIADDEYQ